MNTSQTYDDPNSDNILLLPTNNNQPSYSEMKIIDTLFENNSSINYVEIIKKSLLLFVLFILFSLPQIEVIILQILPSLKDSSYILLALKSLLFVVSYIIIKNYVMKLNT